MKDVQIQSWIELTDMAIRLKKKRRAVDEIPLASTADIAFLLIVFYLASSSLLEFRGVSIPLPKKDAPPMELLKENILKIFIDKEGTLIHDKNKFTLDEMIQFMKEEQKKNPQIVVVLRVNKNAPSGMVPKLLREMQKANIEKFSLGMDK